MTFAPALFLHIQKTAGTSVVQTFREFYGEDIISHLDYYGHKPEEFRNKRFVSGHFGYSYAQHFMKSRYSFTFLRDPAERVLSFYYFCRRSNPDEFPVYKIAQEQTLNGFLDMAIDHLLVKSCIWNHQTWQLSCGWGNALKKSVVIYDEEQMINEAKAHLCEFDHVGFTETFDEDMGIILNDLGIGSSCEMKKENVGHQRLRTNELSSSTKNRMRRITEMDQALFDYAKSSRIKKMVRRNCLPWASI